MFSLSKFISKWPSPIASAPSRGRVVRSDAMAETHQKGERDVPAWIQFGRGNGGRRCWVCGPRVQTCLPTPSEPYFSFTQYGHPARLGCKGTFAMASTRIPQSGLPSEIIFRCPLESGGGAYMAKLITRVRTLAPRKITRKMYRATASAKDFGAQ